MKKRMRKLALAKETLRVLEVRLSQGMAMGALSDACNTFNYGCPSTPNTCACPVNPGHSNRVACKDP